MVVGESATVFRGERDSFGVGGGGNWVGGGGDVGVGGDANRGVWDDWGRFVVVVVVLFVEGGDCGGRVR